MTISLENKLSRVVACVAALLWLFATAGQAVERQKLNFNSGWRLSVGDINAAAVDFDDSRWRQVTRRHLPGSPAAPSSPWRCLRFTLRSASLEISLHRKMSLKPSSVLWRRVSYSPPVPPFTSAPRGCRKPRRTKKRNNCLSYAFSIRAHFRIKGTILEEINTAMTRLRNIQRQTSPALQAVQRAEKNQGCITGSPYRVSAHPLQRCLY